MTKATTERNVLDLIHAEYREMPGLRLTQRQIERFWSLDSATCTRTVAALVDSHVLKQTPEGLYVLATATY
jgi:hypothetical protein